MISMDFPTKQRILPLDTSIGSKRGQNRPPRENEPRQYVGTSLQRVEMRLRSLQVGGFDAISDRTPAAEVCVPRGSGLILLQARLADVRSSHDRAPCRRALQRMLFGYKRPLRARTGPPVRVRFCEGFRMTAHRDDWACTGAVVRKPPHELHSQAGFQLSCDYGPVTLRCRGTRPLSESII